MKANSRVVYIHSKDYQRLKRQSSEQLASLLLPRKQISGNK